MKKTLLTVIKTAAPVAASAGSIIVVNHLVKPVSKLGRVAVFFTKVALASGLYLVTEKAVDKAINRDNILKRAEEIVKEAEHAKNSAPTMKGDETNGTIQGQSGETT